MKMNIKTRKTYIISISTVILIGIIFFTYNNSLPLSGKGQLDHVIDIVSNYIKENPKLLEDSINAINNYEKMPAETIATVNGLAISKSEFEFRKGLKTSVGDKDDDNLVFNTLVEEKIILAFAIKNDIVPNNKQVQEFIDWERDIANADEEYKIAVERFCKQMGVTEDYYDSYEKYNAFRIILLKSAYDFAIEKALKDDVLILDDEDEIAKQTAKENYWMLEEKALKEVANVQISGKYSKLGLIVDKSKLYIYANIGKAEV
jgi:hypothetical protein